jgi:hypothetical protein
MEMMIGKASQGQELGRRFAFTTPRKRMAGAL